MRRIVVAVLLWCGAAPLQAQQQSVVLRVRVEAAGQAVAGALVALLDQRNAVVSERLTGERGSQAFRIVPGTYRVRVRRIGFYPFTSDTIRITADRDLVLRVDSRAVMLRGVVVTASSRCARVGDSATELGLVWSEVLKALRASELTREDASVFARTRQYHRITRRDTLLFADTVIRDVHAPRPFVALDPRRLAREGYVRGNERDGWEYFAPDERVLLSDEFAATHCLRLTRDRSRPGEIGVGFEPAPRHRVPDIAGVIWVDERSAELREVVFRYVRAGLLERFGAGGRTKFVRTPAGAWLVSEWQLRAPMIEYVPLSRDRFNPVGFVEHGGDLLLPDEAPQTR